VGRWSLALTYSISKSLVDEAALVKKLSDSHSSFLAGSLLIAPRREGQEDQVPRRSGRPRAAESADRPALSKWRKDNEVYV